MVGNEVDEVQVVVIPATDISHTFKNFVQSAIEKYIRKQNITYVVVKSTVAKWKNANGEVFSYSLHVGDVRSVKDYLEPQNYTLAIADIPYGFNAPGAEYDDKFTQQDVLDMVTKFSEVTTAKMWRFVIIHSLQ